MKLDIYGDKISYVTDEVSSVKIEESNLNEENRIKFVTDLAAVSRGKDHSKNPPARYKSLLKEAAPQFDGNGYIKTSKSPSRPLEFMAVVLGVMFNNNIVNIYDLNTKEVIAMFNFEHFSNNLSKFGYLQNDKLYTNMRACINAGIQYDKIPYNSVEDLKDFKAIKAMIPMFVWAQVPNTHIMLSKEAQSDRVAENNNYWLPLDFRNRLYEHVSNNEIMFETCSKLLSFNNKEDMINSLLKDYSQLDTQHLFKELGYPREIYSRAMYYFKYKEVVFTGWYNDPNTWKHLFIERNAMPELYENWTQEQTKQFVNCIRSIIEITE